MEAEVVHVTYPEMMEIVNELLVAVYRLTDINTYLYAAAIFVIGLVAAVLVCWLLYRALKVLI